MLCQILLTTDAMRLQCAQLETPVAARLANSAPFARAVAAELDSAANEAVVPPAPPVAGAAAAPASEHSRVRCRLCACFSSSVYEDGIYRCESQRCVALLHLLQGGAGWLSLGW